MLKRNGQNSRREAPQSTGRLKHLEQEAYRTAVSAVGPELEDLATIAEALRRIQAPKADFAETSSEQADLMVGPNRDQWRVRRRLMKLNRSEVVLGQNRSELAVIECFPESSAYARANTSAEILLTGNDERVLLQDYVQNETQALRLMVAGLRAKVSEVLAERYPDQNLEPVIQVFLRRCEHEITSGRSQTHSPSVRLHSNRGLRI